MMIRLKSFANGRHNLNIIMIKLKMSYNTSVYNYYDL